MKKYIGLVAITCFLSMFFLVAVVNACHGNGIETVNIKAESSSITNDLGNCKACGPGADCKNVSAGFNACTEYSSGTCETHGGVCSD